MRRCESGFERALDALEAALAAVPFGTPPPGWSLVEARPMRAVLRGAVVGPQGPVRAIVKWSRPVTILDRLARRLRGGKGVREARLARLLWAADFPVARDLFSSDDHEDLVAFEEVEGLRPLPRAEDAPRALVEAVARTVARLNAAGLAHVDWTRENLGIAPGGPVLLDLGGARGVGGLRGRSRVRELARAASGLLEGASRATRHRALRAWLGDYAAEARSLARPVEAAARRAAARYRAGRDRRTTRTGRHFEVRALPGGGRSVRATDEAPASWRDLPAERLSRGERTPGGRVVRAALPEREGPVAVKAFGEGAPLLRTPRAVRSFRAGWALLHRRLDAATPLLAVAPARGPGALVTAWIDAPDLLAWWGAAAPGAREELLVPLARSLRRVHDAGVSHRDLKASNLLALREEGRWRFPVVDFEGVSVRRRPPGWRRRARDLARLDASLEWTAAERSSFLEAYLRVPPRGPLALDAFASLVAARSEWKRRTVRRRRAAEAAARAPVG